MLTLAKVQRGREEYYLATVAGGRHDDVGLVEPDGQWIGTLAARLGLEGTAQPDAVRALLSGVDPRTGEILNRSRERVRVVAYDCTFSAPKSVSVVHALGPPAAQTAVQSGHEEAARAALGYLERHGATVRRRTGGTRVTLVAGGLAAARFTHRSSRAPDPHLHSHVLVANIAFGPDGRWSALDARSLYFELSTARYLYATQLRAELSRRLGVTWRELRGVWADIDGLDPRVIDGFSRRKAEIGAELEGTGRSGRAARRYAALVTRGPKDFEVSYEELVETWRQRSHRLGLSSGRIATVLGRTPPQAPRAGARRPSPGASLEWAATLAGALGPFAADGTASRSELIRARCRSLGEGGTVAEIEADVDGLVRTRRVIPVGPAHPRQRLRTRDSTIPSPGRERRYTTPEVAAVESRIAEIGSLRLVAYEPGRRLDTLDFLSAMPATVGIARGPGAAASFEAATGIATLAHSGTCEPWRRDLELVSTTIVVSDAHLFGPHELESIAEASRANSVLLVAPEVSLGAGTSSLGRIASRLERVRLGHEREVGARRDREQYCLSGASRCVVEVAPTAATARAAMVEQWQLAGGRRRGAALVAADPAVRDELAALVVAGGGVKEDVCSPHRIPRGTELLIVLGPVSELAQTAGERHLVVIDTVGLGEVERIGLAAASAPERYHLSELGSPPSGVAGRSQWRLAAGAIEQFRQRFRVEDPARAFGDPVAIGRLGGDALRSYRDARRLAVAVRPLERSRSLVRDGPGSLG